MGTFDTKSGLWKTVTKVGTGFDDNAKAKMHKRLDALMEKLDDDSRLPKWVHIKSAMKPDALAKDPMLMPVFEVEGAEFTDATSSDATAEGHHTCPISIRFPRIKKVRDDKSPKEATNMKELMHLYQESKAGEKLDMLDKLKTKDSGEEKGKIASIFTKTASTSKRKSSNDETKESKKLTVCESPKRKQNQVEDDEVPYKKSKEEIFNDFVLFVSSNIQSKDIERFKQLGGRCTKSSISANLVLHDNKEIHGNLEELRELYDPSCRHYQSAWLSDSLKENKVQNPLKYFVQLHQT